MPATISEKAKVTICFAGLLAALGWSGIHPHDYFTWIPEVLLGTTPLKKGKMLFFLVACVSLAFSALYELVEWRVAVATGSAADASLGTQSDVWDSQEDMATCLLGSLVSLLTLGRYHDRLLEWRLLARAT